MNTILVQMSQRQWTLSAVHLACALARNHKAKIILLQLIPVAHPSYLGTQFGNTQPLPRDDDYADTYRAIAQDYGTRFTIQPMQCLTPLEALVDAAHQLEVDAVFAHVPTSRIPYWQAFQTWVLQRRFSAAHRELFMPDQSDPVMERMPAITVKAVYRSTGR